MNRVIKRFYCIESMCIIIHILQGCFISIASMPIKWYSEKTWACVQNGITQRGRLADGDIWQRVARRASSHVSIRQSPNYVMPFWAHAKCLLAFISYLPMWIKARHTFIKTINSPRSYYGGLYMQAKHADVCSGVIFWTACTRRPHVLSLPSRCEKPDSWRQSGSVETAKKSRMVQQCGHVTLNSVQMASKQAKVWFSLHILQFTRLYGVVVMQGLTFWDSVVSNQLGCTYCQAQDFLLRTNYTLEMRCANAKLANQVPASPVKTLVIRMSWSYRRLEWRER